MHTLPPGFSVRLVHFGNSRLIMVARSACSSTSAQLRQKYRSQFFATDARHGTLQCSAVVLFHVLVCLIVYLLAFRSFAAGPVVGCVCTAAAGVVIGSRMRAWGNILHECSHNAFAKNKFLNRVIGNALGVFLFIGFRRYRREHLSHHRFLGDVEKDLDLGGSFFRPTLMSSEEPWLANLCRVLFLVSLVFMVALPATRFAVLAFFVFPYFTSYQLFRFVSDKADHAGISAEPDEFLRSRNHIFSRRWGWLNSLVFPHHDAFHLIHHLFPGLPAKMHRQCHVALLQDANYYAREHEITLELIAKKTPWNIKLIASIEKFFLNW